MKEQWKHEMQEKMADYRKSAPELSWSEIETAVRKSRQAKVVVMWSRRIAVAAAVVLLVGGLGFFAFRQPHKELASHYSKESDMTDNKQQPESVINIIKSTVSPFVRHSATNIVAALKESTDEKTQAIKDDSVKTVAMNKEERTDTEQKTQKPNDRRSYQPYNPIRYSGNNSSITFGSKVIIDNLTDIKITRDTTDISTHIRKSLRQVHTKMFAYLFTVVTIPIS